MLVFLSYHDPRYDNNQHEEMSVMSQFRRLSLIALGLTAAVFCVSANAATQVLISSAPPAKEMVQPPRGYAKCHVVPAGFYHGVWQQQHRVCEYKGNRNRGVWVSGYWKCLNVKPYNGVCVRWSWVPSRWDNQHHMVAYAPPPPPPAYVQAPPPPPRVVVRHAPPVYQ